MISLFLLLFSILGFPQGADIVYALQNAEHGLMVNRIELPAYYLIFILLGIAAVTWGVVKIFQHKDHEH